MAGIIPKVRLKTCEEKVIDDRNAIIEFRLKDDGYSRRVAPRRSVFDLRTKSMRTDDGVPKQGRVFDTKHSREKGGIRVDEMIFGMKMAHLSITDDSEDRLKDVSPNGMAALRKLVGGEAPEATARLSLSEILKQRFDLKLDCWIDESGVRRGRPVDTQGFIASNDSMVVLSYRFTTSIFDWMANINFTSSEWKLDSDEDLGHAGYFSICRGRYTKLCKPSKSRPRVQTAYYNNFIYTIPMIRKYIIDPLLKENDDENILPKKIYVVGSSLGAAVSQIAYCFILEELFEHLVKPDFTKVERLIAVNSGCPRVGDIKFKNHIQAKMDALRPLDRAVICRLVYNNDVVPHAPPNLFNFHHLDKMIYITRDGKQFLVNPDLSKHFTRWGEIKTIYQTIFRKKKKEFDEKTEVVKAKYRESVHFMTTRSSEVFGTNGDSNHEENPEKEEEDKTEFEKELEAAPEAIRDHMQFFYMTFLDQLKAEQDAYCTLTDRIEEEDETSSADSGGLVCNNEM